MSLTKTLKDKFKNAQAVTSLASTDRVMMIDPNGGLRKISPEELDRNGKHAQGQVEAGSSGWLRIAKVNYDSNGIIKISKAWGATTPKFLLLCYLCHVNGVQKVSIMAFLGDGGTILSKARIVYKANTDGYLDVYAPIPSRESFYVDLLGGMNTTLSLGSNTNAVVPEGFSVKEFSNLASVGGGKLLPFNQLRNLAERRVA